jgi:hypothetical protein
MPQIIDENSGFCAPDVAAPPLSTAEAGGISTTVVAALSSALPCRDTYRI